jgi:hypothetical protein
VGQGLECIFLNSLKIFASKLVFPVAGELVPMAGAMVQTHVRLKVPVHKGIKKHVQTIKVVEIHLLLQQTHHPLHQAALILIHQHAVTNVVVKKVGQTAGQLVVDIPAPKTNLAFLGVNATVRQEVGTLLFQLV